MRYFLDNEDLRLEIDSLGAELKSARDARSGREYLWQADPRYWKRTSPVLFPLVGSYYEKKSVYDGRTYEMSQHGFARDMEFHSVSKEAQEIFFELKDSEGTREKYPFSFALRIGYRLKGRTVEVLWEVENTDGRIMYFSIGAHPAFNCDLDKSYLTFDTGADTYVSGILGEGGCLTGRVKELKTKDGKLWLSDSLFSEDALILEDRQAQSVTLWQEGEGTEKGSGGNGENGGKSEEAERVVRVDFDTPLFGLWSPVNKHAPFMCIEPWYGRSDREGFSGKLEEREYGNVLKGGEIFRAGYSMTFGRE